MGIMEYLRLEARQRVDPQGERWRLFARNSSSLISTGSLVRLTYRASRSSPSPVTFIGVLLAIRRSPGNPTILVRGLIDEVGVEQVFCIFSPLLERIEVLQPPAKPSGRKLYYLRDKPAAILELQKAARPGKGGRSARTVTSQ